MDVSAIKVYINKNFRENVFIRVEFTKWEQKRN